MHTLKHTLGLTLITAIGYSLSGCAATPVASSTTRPPGGGGAAAAGSAPGQSDPGVTANCQPDATEMSGSYRYNNNQWGRNKAKAKGEQCLLTRQFAERTERGWSWSWPGFDPSVFAYPEIEFGW